MLAALKKWFSLPDFPDDEEKSRLARMMTTISAFFVIILLVAAVIFVPFLAVHKVLGWSIIGGLLLVSAAVRYLMVIGRVDESNTLLVVCTWLVFQVMVIFSGSIFSPVSIAVVAVITLAGLLLKKRLGLVLFFVSCTIGLALVILQMLDMVPPSIFNYSALAAWFWFSMALAFVFGTVSLVTRTLYAALNREHEQRIELQHKEITLRESEQKFRDVIEQSFDAYILSDEFGNLIEWNRAAEQLTAIPREQVLGRKIWDVQMQLVAPEKRLPKTADLNRQLISRVLETGQLPAQSRVQEVVYHTVRGEHTWVEQSSFPIKTARGYRLAVVNSNITDRKQKELELQAIAALSAALRTASSRAEMLPVILEQLVTLLDAEAAAIQIIDLKTGEETAEAAIGAWKFLEGSSQPCGTGLNRLIRQTMKPYSTAALDLDPNRPDPAWLGLGIQSAVGAPLIAQQQLIGFIWIGRRTGAAEDQVRLLAAVADIAANAIHRSTLHEQTQRDAEELAQAYDTTLEGWAHALELRDHETEGHSQRVTALTLRLGIALGLDEIELLHLRRGALLHDIGKMGIPDHILHKPGPLDDEEWQIMRKHPQYAYDLLSTIRHLQPALDIPYCHHEKWDGSGYPRQLKGEEIPLGARLFSVVDVWDALSNDRPYRRGLPADQVVNIIREQSGANFDPRIVGIFLDLVKENA